MGMSQSTIRAPESRLKYPWLCALRNGSLPPTVSHVGKAYRHHETFKHDFFAATGLYDGPDGLAVLKLGRTTDFLSLPMDWLGNYLEGREYCVLQRIQDIPGVPRLIGQIGSNGLLREFVPGHPLGRREAVSDSFFAELESILKALHARHIAYVDLNKRQNILVGNDGRPYLIDFQISLHIPPTGWGRFWPFRWLLARFQQADTYHYLKHKRRLRPDLLTPAERARVERLSLWIRLHRYLTRPLTYLRRSTLVRLHKTEIESVPGSAAK
jgi:hypothetical protein